MLADDAIVIHVKKFASVLNKFVEFADESTARGMKSAKTATSLARASNLGSYRRSLYREGGERDVSAVAKVARLHGIAFSALA